MYNFVIPVKNSKLIKDQQKHLEYLNQLIESALKQKCEKKIWIICPSDYEFNHDHVERINLDLKLPDQSLAKKNLEEYYRQFRIDKGSRIKKVYDQINSNDWIIPLDDDDLLHKNYINSIQSTLEDIYVLTSGYKWFPISNTLVTTEHFDKYCGTSLGYKKSVMEKYESRQDFIEILGSHSEIKKYEAFYPIKEKLVLWRLENVNSSQELLKENEAFYTRLRKILTFLKRKYLLKEHQITDKEYWKIMGEFK